MLPFSLPEPSDRQARALLLFVGLCCLLLFGATLFLPHSDGHLIGSDGRSYFSTLRSLVFDGDFDFGNEYAYVGFAPKPLTATGLPENPFAIGMPLLWLPFFLAAHLLSLLLNALGLAVSTDGLGLIYEAAVCLATIVYGAAAFLLLYRVLRRLFEPWPSLVAILALWLGSAAIYYMVAEPSMSHAVTLFTAVLFLALWYPIPPQRSWPNWLALGASAGLAALVRWQDGILILLPLVELIWRLGTGQLALRKFVACAALLLAAALLVFSPQFIMWARLYGTPLTIPQGSDFFNWLAPKPLLTLFSTRHGLFTWHPVLLIALVGLVPLWRRDRALTLAILLLFTAQLYLNSAIGRWWADDAFGGRRFTSLIPFLAFPLAALLEKVRGEKRATWALLALFALLIVWNMLGTAQFALHYVSRSEALAVRELTVDRFLLPLQMLSGMRR